MNIRPEPPVAVAPAPEPMDPRTRALLHGPIVPTLLRMAWPNVVIMFAQAATGLIETYWVGRLGTDALAGMALVFPGVMLMQMISAGALGGGISSAIARALGGGRREEADALVLHAIVINVLLGACFATAVLIWGRPLYSAMGGEGGSLEAALTYSNIVFGGNILLWVMNGLASVILDVHRLKSVLSVARNGEDRKVTKQPRDVGDEHILPTEQNGGTDDPAGLEGR